MPGGSSSYLRDFNRTNLGSSDWAVTSRNGSFGVPRIVGNRLRLTDNSGNVATGATFQRLLPATGNYVQVQFKYYAYNGNGADGVAVIFSDASVTPQPGGYGGSLGYAQLNGTSGFAGGWLGVALDEYGNFSNPTETRDGGPGLRQDSVSIRGSGTGTGGYRYLAGTSANLNPGIDVSGATAGPGHTYRITLDSTVTGRTMVTVERNTGSGFTTLISSFNAQAAAGQLGLPTDFFLSLTGSTGGSNNIHELDDFQVCANRINSIGQQIDHFEYSYSGTALTCNPQPITIKACLNSSCSSLYTDPVRVTMSPTRGWSATAPATVTGGNVINFSGGSATTQLRSGAGEIVIGEISSLPASRPLTQRVCSTSGCKVTFSDSAFLLNVPHMVAGKEVDATIQAVRKADNAEVCVPGFANVTRDVRFNAVYSNPDAGTRSVIVNGTNISTTTDADKTSATPTTLSLTFDSIGRADPKLKVRYNDAGLMTLYASHVDSTANPGSAGYLIEGSDTFIARPVGLCVYSDTVNSDCAGGDASCSKFVMAGDSFRLRVGGVVWQSNNDSDLCSGNLKTPNYRQNGIALTHTLVAPVGGEAGNLGVVSTDILASDQGERILTNQTISEVGVFTITATAPANYLGSSNSPTPRVGDTDNDGVIDVVSTSVNIGRFYPASFSLEDPAVKSACNVFTYAGLVDRDTPPVQLGKVGQPFPASGVLSARNRSGGVTHNYVGGFAKLKDSDISYADSGGQGVISTGTTDLAADASKGSGYLKYDSVGLSYQFDQLRGPYKLAALITATDSDGVTGSVTDHVIDDATGAPENDLLPDFRIGQARVANAHGSELQDLALPFFAAYFNGSGYAPNPLDSCTPFTPAELDDYQRSGTGDGSPELVDQSYMALAGGGAYLLKAPGESSGGSQWVTFGSEQSPAPEWLRFDWDEDGELDNPRGLATFGIYKGAAPLIFRREVYGQ
jgi:MSHA biogenesis protein MshQ